MRRTPETLWTQRPEASGEDVERAREIIYGHRHNSNDTIVAVASALTATRRAGAEAMRERADATFERMWSERAADGDDEFTRGLLAGMTELMNAVRALPADTDASGKTGT